MKNLQIMNTNLNKRIDIEDEFSSLFEFKSEDEELKHDANMLMFKFLSELERVTEDTLLQKDLAEALNTSKSFISQLYKGNKLANLTTLAKLQKAFNITFDIKGRSNNESVQKPLIEIRQNALDYKKFNFPLLSSVEYSQRVSIPEKKDYNLLQRA